MILSKQTPCEWFDLGSPIWGGGKRVAGLDMRRIKKHNRITFSYVRKSDGKKSIPGDFYFDGEKMKDLDFETMTRGTTPLLLVPFGHLEPLMLVDQGVVDTLRFAKQWENALKQAGEPYINVKIEGK